MSSVTSSGGAKAVVRRKTEEVQGKGNFDVFEELFAEDFIDHRPRPNTTPDKSRRSKTLHLFQPHSRTSTEIHWLGITIFAL
jgi:hypothetical protein